MAPLELYLLRHATAVDVGAPRVSTDAQRYLSDEGVAEMKEAAKGIRKIEKQFALILTSPLPRASQTAHVAARALDAEDAVEECDWLKPGAAFDEVAAEINRRKPQGAVMIVGHNPDFEDIVAQALCPANRAAIEIKKGGLAILRFESKMAPGRGLLRALLTCKHLRLMGGK